MSPRDFSGPHWNKSSYSNDSANCVEVSLTGSAIGVRDSKDPVLPALAFASPAWSAFVGRVSGMK
ncbi:DUF397 domain-containing protein [Amycolatopsis sp. H20-H5]|uniref:DUF397 domain-containing protein n=1 Tax=Amycolatopsis sp. H20-H5 TaxID=3046309 RepID=UPI002DBD5E39|nr:DUF397 domain-containing protein [Amycolatopsis sp. H20-H5]MEC3976659.1 DUF397 domain-containing protein [Amycolatopsis sp. H20-H5]